MKRSGEKIVTKHKIDTKHKIIEGKKKRRKIEETETLILMRRMSDRRGSRSIRNTNLIKAAEDI